MTPGLGLFVCIFNELKFKNTEYFLPIAHNYYMAEKKFELRPILAINTKNTKKGVFSHCGSNECNTNLTYRIVSSKLPLIY